MLRSPAPHRAFTLIEMLTVMLVIAILAGIILSLNSIAQNKAARARAEGEMKSISTFIENYKTDFGAAPRSDDTDALDPRTHTNPTASQYRAASRFLYIALSGDTNTDGVTDNNEGRNYGGEFFKPSVLNANKDGTGKIVAVNYLKDPFDNSYGYSTAGAATEEAFIESLRSNPKATRPGTPSGYNPTFDLWSTGGSVGGSGGQAKWVKNW